MNSDTGNPASSKGRSSRGESNIDSGLGSRGSKAEPMRVAVMRLNDSEFRVAEREDGGTSQDRAPQRHESFNAPAYPPHVPWQALTLSQSKPSSLKVASAPKPTSFKALQPTLAHHDPFNAPAHLIHAHGATKIAPVQVPQFKTAAPKQNPQQSQPEDIDHYVPLTLEDEITQQQYTENRQRDNSHEHHAIAVPAHRPNKIKEDEDLDDPTDHHNHHRHQCDDEDCSDHDDSRHHLHYLENAPTPMHSLAFAPQQKPTPVSRSTMSFARPTMSSAMKNRAAPFLEQQQHHVDPFNAPAHLLHAVDSAPKKASIAVRKHLSSAHQPKPFARPLLFASMAAATPKAAVKPNVASLKARPTVWNNTNRHLLHEPFNAPAHLLHASKQNTPAHLKFTTPAPKQKSAEPSVHLGRSVGHRGHHPLHNMNPVEAPEYDIVGPLHHGPSHAQQPSSVPSASSAHRPQSHAHAHAADENINRYAHPTSEVEIADQQHAENHQRGTSHSHHAHAVQAHRDLKIPRHPENEDPKDHHNHYRHQYDEGTHSTNDDFVVSPMLNLGSLFSAANSSGLGDYTYSNAATHKRHHPHLASAATHKINSLHRDSAIPEMSLGSLFAENKSYSLPKAHYAEPSQPREHLVRSFGHHGHHPQHDLKPIEGPEYDIEGPSNRHHQEQPLLPTSWFKEPTQNATSAHIARGAPAGSVSEDPAELLHQENRQRGNSNGHHAHAVPARRDHRPHHQHEYDDATDRHNHFRHQTHDENCGEHHDDFGNMLPTAEGDYPLTSLGHLFSAANSSGLGGYTYSEAVTHMRHHRAAAVAPKKTQKSHKAAPFQTREHLDRSFGQHGHHPLHDLNPVEGPEYDIEGPSNHHHQKQYLLPTAWFKEPAQNATSIQIARSAPADSAPEDQAEGRHQENRQRGNSHGHHAHAVPAHRDHKPHHHHEYDDANDKHNHFRHQPHDENCSERHDDFGNVIPTAAGDSPLTSLGRLFSAANSSGLRNYTYAEAVSHKRRLRATATLVQARKRAPLNPKRVFKYMSRPHLGRSYGHHGHHPQHDLNPVEGPQYDIVGPTSQQLHRHYRRSEKPLLATSWFDEPTQNASTVKKPAARLSPEELGTRHHQENRERGNSHGHHAYAVPAHRDHRAHHQHVYDDAIDKHNQFRHQPHDENCGEHHDDFGNMLPTAAGDSPLMSLGHLFSAANSSGLGDYTYAESVTHRRHPHPAAAPKKGRRAIHKTQPSLRSRQHLGRSYGHRGHHPQHDLSPVEGPKYDISGPPRQHHHRMEQFILPVALFAEPLSIHISSKATAPAASMSPEEEAAARRHLENKRRGNSHGHHAHTVPTHRPRKSHHNHDNDDATDKHDHFRHQPHNENCGTDHHDDLGFQRASAASDSPLLTWRKIFSSANSSCLGNYTYAEAVTHKRHSRPSPPVKPSKASKRSRPKTAMKPASALNHQHLGRSYGHRGHHAQKDLNPVEGPEYDIVDPPNQQPNKHHHHRKDPNSNESILPFSWFEEPIQTHQQRMSSADAVPTASELDASACRRVENKRRGNSGCHHARAVPAHRPHKPRHNHDNDDATDKHDHFRRQSHDENCGTDHHDKLGNLRPSAASDSPLLTLRKMFSSANSSCLGDYTYAEAVSDQGHAHYHIHAAAATATPKTRQTEAATPEMNLGALFAKTESSLSQHNNDHHGSHEHHERSFGHHGHHPQHDLNTVEAFDYDIEGYQRHPNDQEDQQQQQPIPAPMNAQKDEDVATPDINFDDWYPEHEPSQQGSGHGPREHHERSFGHHGHQAQHDLSPVEGFDLDIEGYEHHPNTQEQNSVDGFNGYKFTPPALPLHGLRTRHSGIDLRQVDALAQYRPAGEYRSPLSQRRPPSSSNASHSHPHPSTSNLDIKPYGIRIVIANMPSHHASGPSTAVPQEQQEQPISKKERKQAWKLQRQLYRKLRKSQAKFAATTPVPEPFKLHCEMDDDVYVEAVKLHSKHHAPYPDSLDNQHHYHHHHLSLDSASASAPAQPEVCKKERKQALKRQRQAALELRKEARQKTATPNVVPTLAPQEPSKKERKQALKQLRHSNRKLRKSQQKALAPYELHGAMDDDVYVEAAKLHSKHHAPYPDSFDSHYHHHSFDSASAPAYPEVCKKERKQALKRQRQAAFKLRKEAHQKTAAPNVVPPLAPQEPSKKERKQALKQLRHTDRKSQQKTPASYKADGSLEDDVYVEAVKENSMHHAPYPDSLDNNHHHHHHAAADHDQAHHRHHHQFAPRTTTTSDNGKDIKDPKYGPGHVHISEYQKQLHHFDYNDRHHAQTISPHPKHQPQRQQTPKVESTAASSGLDGYLKLSSKLFKQPLTDDYYAEDANTLKFPELAQFRLLASNGHRERTGPAQ